jgi:hypothetical protein
MFHSRKDNGIQILCTSSRAVSVMYLMMVTVLTETCRANSVNEWLRLREETALSCEHWAKLGENNTQKITLNKMVLKVCGRDSSDSTKVTRDWLLWTQEWTFWFHKSKAITKRLLVSWENSLPRVVNRIANAPRWERDELSLRDKIYCHVFGVCVT